MSALPEEALSVIGNILLVYRIIEKLGGRSRPHGNTTEPPTCAYAQSHPNLPVIHMCVPFNRKEKFS